MRKTNTGVEEVFKAPLTKEQRNELFRQYAKNKGRKLTFDEVHKFNENVSSTFFSECDVGLQEFLCSDADNCATKTGRVEIFTRTHEDGASSNGLLVLLKGGETLFDQDCKGGRGRKGIRGTKDDTILKNRQLRNGGYKSRGYTEIIGESHVVRSLMCFPSNSVSQWFLTCPLASLCECRFHQSLTVVTSF